ncbi:Alpha/Beta hydrolase protein [Lipomyces kononenkoae]|uniref:Alpha/Beta hydrolase protein n=1 Tax=Lipomyces kononenkoae TaxID=34357 RepID=A0ACC3SRW8_LIPKO
MNDTVTSKDGTIISYLKVGEGPGIIILHGAMESAWSHFELARALSDSFTVYLPDRRGRGRSGPYGPDFIIQKEVEDVDALLSKTDSHFVMGVSAGAIIALNASLELKAIHKAIIFEPPLMTDNLVSVDWVDRYDKEISAGKVAAALVTGMLGSQMGPPALHRMPRWFLIMMTKLMMTLEGPSDGSDGPIPMKVLAPTLHYDVQLILEFEDKQKDLVSTIGINVLLLGGSLSPPYLKAAVDRLEKTIPNAKRVEFAGFHHGATGNKNRGGHPETVASEIKSFLLAQV